MSTKEGNLGILLIFILCGLVLGGLLGEFASKFNILWWLSYGQQFGLEAPLILDLNIISITFAFSLKINVASIIGIVVSFLLYKKI